MTRIGNIIAATTLSAAALATALAPVSAAPFVPQPQQPSASSAANPVVDVRYQDYWRRFTHGGRGGEVGGLGAPHGAYNNNGPAYNNGRYANNYRGAWRGNRHWHNRHGWYGRNRGWDGGGALLGGLVTGAIVGSLLNDSRPHYRHAGRNAHERWCYERYRSYRAWDNTFQPNHGPRRACVSPYG